LSVNNFSWVIPGKLAGSAIPSFIAGVRDDAAWLAGNGVGMLVSLTMPGGYPEEECPRSGIEWIHYPIHDFGVPSEPATFAELVGKIVAAMNKNVGVCIHCHAGIGRTGMALSCVVGKYLSISADQAIAAVRKARTSMETREQEDYTRRFLDGR
jgi:atypical dual specificity phosphatase